MVWFGVGVWCVWCGVVWCGVVWCGVVWCGVVWCGVVWCGVVWCGVVWCGVVWCGVVWCVRCGVVWCGVVWCGVVWCGVVWCGVVWCGVGVVWCGADVWCGVWSLLPVQSQWRLLAEAVPPDRVPPAFCVVGVHTSPGAVWTGCPCQGHASDGCQTSTAAPTPPFEVTPNPQFVL